MQDAPRSPLNALSALHPEAIRRMTGFPEPDDRFAFIPELMARPDLAERSLRQGITLLFLDEQGALAALVFQEQLFGLLELPFAPEIERRSPDVLISLLDDFRLGWLPQEMAQALSGHVWRPCDLPAEAEGFAPVFAAGPLARHMQGRARILDNQADPAP